MKTFQRTLIVIAVCLILPKALVAQSELPKSNQGLLLSVRANSQEVLKPNEAKYFFALALKTDEIFFYFEDENSGGCVNAEPLKIGTYLISLYNVWWRQILIYATTANVKEQQKTLSDQINFWGNSALHTPYGENL